MKVYQISREFYPYANAGGLKEVVTGLGTALAGNGHDSSVFIPCYGFIDKSSSGFKKMEIFYIDVKGLDIKIRTYFRNYFGVKVYLFDYQSVSDKNDIYTYTAADELQNCEHKKGCGFKDSNHINIVFQLAFLEYVTRFLESPDVLLLHDGHTGLIPAIINSRSLYSMKFRESKIFFTIHNAGLAYHQRTYAPDIRAYNIINEDTLCDACFSEELDPLCLAVLYSVALTVSPYYAKEILQLEHEDSSDGFGEFCNTHNVSITGITNGVDIGHYNNYGIIGLPDIKVKSIFRNELEKLIAVNPSLKLWGSISPKDSPLFIFQNRITEQKGIDKLIDAIRDSILNGSDSQFIVMGQGEHKYEKMLIQLASESQCSICYIQGYDEEVAKKLFLSSDFFILTSLWEPCGLTDFEAQLAGSIPIVHKTGGLQKVINKKTGFVYDTFQDLEDTIALCENLYRDNRDILNEMKIEAYNLISDSYTWDKVLLNKYIPLFKRYIEN